MTNIRLNVALPKQQTAIFHESTDNKKRVILRSSLSLQLPRQGSGWRSNEGRNSGDTCYQLSREGQVITVQLGLNSQDSGTMCVAVITWLHDFILQLWTLLLVWWQTIMGIIYDRHHHHSHNHHCQYSASDLCMSVRDCMYLRACVRVFVCMRAYIMSGYVCARACILAIVRASVC